MTASPSQTSTQKPARKRKMSMERVMVMFTLFFIIGIGLLVIFPEGHVARAVVMPIYSIVVFWAVFRFGM
jgi:hypothetical protein